MHISIRLKRNAGQTDPRILRAPDVLYDFSAEKCSEAARSDRGGQPINGSENASWLFNADFMTLTGKIGRNRMKVSDCGHQWHEAFGVARLGVVAFHEAAMAEGLTGKNVVGVTYLLATSTVS